MSRQTAQDKGQTTKSEVGPLRWMVQFVHKLILFQSPESIDQRVYSKASDVSKNNYHVDTLLITSRYGHLELYCMKYLKKNFLMKVRYHVGSSISCDTFTIYVTSSSDLDPLAAATAVCYKGFRLSISKECSNVIHQLMKKVGSIAQE